VIVVPLLSTGVIPVSARVAIIAPLGRPNATRPPDGHPSAGGLQISRAVSLTVRPCVVCRHEVSAGPRSEENSLPITVGSVNGPPLPDAPLTRVVPEQPPPRIHVSVISEGQLLTKVEPVYPRIAIITGAKGDVRLHAIIAKDGTIQSLIVVSGPPLLVPAAREAVSRWRYRPYLLNGQPVEVETFITVSFKGIRD
ncbi:MAG TPA: energy transducer TonB, partial [Terriglobales bacterium]